MLKSIVADLESVEEPLRSFYLPNDGRYILAVDAVEGFGLEDVGALKRALASERMAHAGAINMVRDHQAKLETYGDLDPVAAREALERVAAGFAGDIEREVEVRLDRLRSQVAASAKAEVDTVKETLAKRETQLQRLMKDSVIRAELDKVKPIDDAVDALMIMAGNHIALTEVDGELTLHVIDRKGELRVNADGTLFSVPAFMQELRETRPGLFQATKAVEGVNMAPGLGNRLPPAGGVNPWAVGSLNITQQVMMEARDPARAARMRAEAGR